MILDHLTVIATVAAIVLSGTMAGLFFVFSTSVMSGMKLLPEKEGMHAMIIFNRTILNPLFLTLFVGSAAAGVISLLGVLTGRGEPATIPAVVGNLAYLLGGFGLTIGYHVPRNNRLDALSADNPEDRRYWPQYQREWNRMNYVRAAFSALAASLLAISLLS